MKNNYSYLRQISFMDSVSVDDIGNVVLDGYNDIGDRYILIIRTVLGISRILDFGPI